MLRSWRLAVAATCALAACAPNPPAGGPAGAPTLTAFGSDPAFARFQQRMDRDWQARMRKRPIYSSYPATPEPPPMGRPVPAGEPVEASAPGVHQPGIVKVTRDYLVILRQNRLHTVRIAGGALDTVASIDAFAPGAAEHLRGGDGIVVSGDVVAVVASERGPVVQAALFRLDAAGGLAYLRTIQLRSGGGEGREPIVRMVDGKLVVFAPAGVWAGNPAGIDPYLPAVRRWESESTDTAWTQLVRPAAIYRPATDMRADDGPTLHALTVCDVAGGAPECRATVVYAPRSVAHHLSRTAAYGWTTQRQGYDEPGTHPDRSMLYRIPLDGGAPSALGVNGQPRDAFSFDETAEGELHVVLSGALLPADRAPAGWNSVELLRAPLAAFGDGSRKMGREAYRGFPNPGSTAFHSRFAGAWIVYGTETENGAYGTWEEGRAFAVLRDGAGAAVPVPLRGPLIAIDVMGADALLTTIADGLRYHPLRLGGTAEPGEAFGRGPGNVWDAEAHAVFYEPALGVLGVARSGFAYTPSVLFLRREGSGFREMGEVAATVPPGTECLMCGGYLDYARPVFLRGRTLAIIGGEVVEVAVENGRIRELRRIRIGLPALSGNR